MEFIVLIFIGFAILTIIAAVNSHKRAEERKAGISLLARRCGWTFETAEDSGMEDRFPGFEFLSTGSDRHAYNILTGPYEECEALCYDYHYETESTDSKSRRRKHHHYFSVAMLCPRFSLKDLVIREEGFFDGIKAMFGSNDIDFESAEFSREFHVSATDRKYAYDVIHPRTMEYLLASPHRNFVMAHGWIAVKSKGLVEPETFLSMLEAAHTLITAIPTHAR